MKRVDFGKMYKQILFVPAVGFAKRGNNFHFKRVVVFCFLNFYVRFCYRLRDNKFKIDRVPYNGERLRIDIKYCEFTLAPSFGMRFLPVRYGYKYSLCFSWGHLFMCYRIGKF